MLNWVDHEKRFITSEVWFDNIIDGLAEKEQRLKAITGSFGITVDSRYLEVEGTLWNTSRYPYFDISDVQNWGKYHPNNQISQMNI